MSHVITFERDMQPLGNAVVAIGVFDGVHLGHQTLIRDAIDIAEARGVRSIVLTFDRDPDRVVMPDRAAPQLLELEDKVRLLSALDPDVVLVVPFDTALAAMAPEAFVSEVLAAAVTPIAVVVGHNFRFGTAASGDVDTLATLGLTHGFTVHGHELLEVDGQPVTSTRIRGELARGDVETAARLLGRRHYVTGRVVHGRGEGHSLGVPTANVLTHSWSALPLDGVFAAFAHIGDKKYPCAVSVGVPPSFPAAKDRVEAHLIDYSGVDLYGESLSIEFVTRLRAQHRFDDPKLLAAAIAEDICRARAVLAKFD
jgi:riboflavin kinase/FMN adenylyltransferase